MTNRKPVLGKFGKGVKQSRQLSTARSATANCDPACNWFDNGCYAARLDSGLYPGLNAKLKRLERADDCRTFDQAGYEVSQLRHLVWFRFFALGAAPMPKKIRDNLRFWLALVRLCKVIRNKIGSDRKIHFPVESYRKWRLYNAKLKSAGVVVRESLQDERRLSSINHPCSIVIGRRLPLADRPAACRETVQAVRDQGRTAIICPAVISDSKCGKCTACGDDRVDLVVYPFHA